MLLSATASLFKCRFHPSFTWQNNEYFEILYDKWRIFCKLLNVYISFTGDIINPSVMFYHFEHERVHSNSDPTLWVDGLYIIPLGVVTCHTNCASNICDHSARYFYSGVQDTSWHYCNIWVFNQYSHPVYDSSFIMVKKNSPRSLFALKQTTQESEVYMSHTTISNSVPKVFSLPHIQTKN